MRLMRASEHRGLLTRWLRAWRVFEADGAVIYDLSDPAPRFFCFFLLADRAIAAPRIAFDCGHGFDELTAVAFRRFPFGFYHVPLASIGTVRRVRLRPCSQPGRVRCLVFTATRPVPVALLHYCFNLRYQKIGIVAPVADGSTDLRSLIVGNYVRIKTFFATVAGGRALSVQQRDDDMVERLRFWQTHQAKPIEAAMRARHLARETPLISLVSPVYNTPRHQLDDLTGSFAAQEARYAELILVDDGSTSAETRDGLARARIMPGVSVVTMPVNAGIAAASNGGVAAARGTWVGFIDHDDAVASGALAVVADAIGRHPRATFFYTDEVITDGALGTTGCFCKPAFDPVLLSGMNYINHFSFFRRDRLGEIDALRTDRDGSQDYDLLLRYLDGVDESTVVHIPFLAYIWRRGENSYSAVFRDKAVANARDALRHVDGLGRKPVRNDGRVARVTVEPAPGNPDLHRVRFAATEPPPISVIIPNRDSLSLIARIYGDLRDKTRYPGLDIVVPDNGTTDPAVLSFYGSQAVNGLRVERIVEPFNFSRMCNRGARLATNDLLLFLNNDVEVIEHDWLLEMVECLSFPRVGIVGARLLFPNGRLQHAGVMVGLGDAAGHWFDGDEVAEPGPMGRLAVRQTTGAVTGACLLVSRACFDAIGGFDETAFPVAYNDVDLCLRAAAAGWRTVWTPFATLRHHESLSRGSDESGANRERFLADKARLRERHGTDKIVDPAFSPFYDRRYSRPRLAVPEDLPPPRLNILSV